MRTTRAGIAALAVTSVLALAACTGGDGGGDGGGDDRLTIWTIEDVADRVATQEDLMARFTEETGVEVELVAVAEDQLTTVLTSAAASGELPDAIAAVPLNSVQQFATDDLLDPDAAGEVVEALGRDTFSEQALELTSDGDTQLAVPSDGWAQLLYYRTDLFEAAGLEAPTSLDAIAEAAAALDSEQIAGITAATAPGDGFTQQTFEHFALANGCDLVDDEGGIALDSEECVDTLDWFTSLVRDSSVAGNQDVDTTRATYFSGGAAMVVWSSFLLDELAGLRSDALPTCAECGAHPTWLAKNTGIVSGIEGRNGGEPASYGEIVSWAILDGASPSTADLVEWAMDDAYPDWLALAPEGKVPVRLGTEGNQTEFTDAWQSLEAGVDTKALLSSVYAPEVLQAVADAPDSFDRWGLPQGQGPLSGAVSGQLVLPKAISDMLNSGLSAEEAASRAAEEAATIQEELDF
ncbi:multiple sugar transport system substrate-binding protein [Diaminobutyricimonas aerilata]|uniref:Multiple sugar transport system substrate-binding protein n=1 Tax=Diaminobutyricimonas aerilata TaxID=1162967 RepID=A0A2M9CL40_9MICO|nr:extracellular solute-binding protein [Diaminobutyricimonas aerilata]PJJ72599.1 multiple sugar transport system substrate-binding protein [Diaminobutyricimonas aerilata]